MCDCKDADQDESGNDCDAISKEPYLCTRPKGHDGPHHAHGTIPGDCMEIWCD